MFISISPIVIIGIGSNILSANRYQFIEVKLSKLFYHSLLHYPLRGITLSIIGGAVRRPLHAVVIRRRYTIARTTLKKGISLPNLKTCRKGKLTSTFRSLIVQPWRLWHLSLLRWRPASKNCSVV